MAEQTGWWFDIEANGLYLQGTTVWYIRLMSFDYKRTMALHPFKEGKEETARKLKEWIHSFPDGCIVQLPEESPQWRRCCQWRDKFYNLL